MSLGVATVLSVRDWEPALVSVARDSAVLRIVVRAFRPHDIDRYVDDIDVIVVGGDTSWLTPAHIRGWRNRGPAVLGIAPVGDEPAADLLAAGGAEDVVLDTIPVEALVQAIRFVAPESRIPSPDPAARCIGVVGARGAPGCTEVAVAFAESVAADSSCILVDLDVEAPSVAVRLGLEPRPDLADAIDAVHADGSLDPATVQHMGPLSVIVGPHRAVGSEFRTSHIEGVIRAAANQWSTVVMDLGSSTSVHGFLEYVDDAILVVDASALGIVRASQLIERWIGPAPALVLNRVDPSTRETTIDAVRRWTGLEPAVVVADRRAVRRAACSARAPERRFARAVGQLGRVS